MESRVERRKRTRQIRKIKFFKFILIILNFLVFLMALRIVDVNLTKLTCITEKKVFDFKRDVNSTYFQLFGEKYFFNLNNIYDVFYNLFYKIIQLIK